MIQYVYQRYGPEHAAMACTLVTFRRAERGRDVGKALGLPLSDLGALADDAGGAGRRSGNNPVYRQLAAVVRADRRLPAPPGHPQRRHGHHRAAAGRARADRAGHDAGAGGGAVGQGGAGGAGLVKIDILGLRMLSLIAEAVRVVGQGQRPVLPATFDDPAVYEMIGRADTIGVFQVESRAQAQMLPIFQPRRFDDLIVSISLIRPGPSRATWYTPTCAAGWGKSRSRIRIPCLKPALDETLGVILFQEQVLKVARDLAGFTPGRGNSCAGRWAAKTRTEAIEAFHDAVHAGGAGAGRDAGVAEEVFDQLQAFGGYSFPKSHAAAFAVLVYQSAWLKRYHPAAFYAALLNHQPMGFWSPAVFVNDARRHGMPVLPVDIHRSEEAVHGRGGRPAAGLQLCQGLGRGEHRAAGRGAAGGTVRRPGRFLPPHPAAAAPGGEPDPGRGVGWLGHAAPQAAVGAGQAALPGRGAGPGLRRRRRGAAGAFRHARIRAGSGRCWAFPRGHLMDFYRAWLDEHGILSSADAQAAPERR